MMATEKRKTRKEGIFDGLGGFGIKLDNRGTLALLFIANMLVWKSLLVVLSLTYLFSKEIDKEKK